MRARYESGGSGLRLKARAEQIHTRYLARADRAVHVLLDDIPPILMSADPIGDVQAIFKGFNRRVQQQELIGIAKPLSKVFGRRLAIGRHSQAGRDQRVELHIFMETFCKICPGLLTERQHESLANRN
jgi:hypothetical protein